MDLHFVEALRQAEIELAICELRQRKPLGSSVIEIGGGAGWQARALSHAGFQVRSFDLADSNLVGDRVFPIEEYDGHRIPADSNTFDVVFSSNVLEHIAHVEAFQSELQRVLKPGGIAIHLLPSATWRVHTTLAHYPWLAKAFVGLIRSKLNQNQSADVHIISEAASKRSKWQLLGRILLSPTHGEKGNTISETWYFSRYRWTPLFHRTGWQVLSHYPNRLYYTGYQLLADRLSIEMRRRLSLWLGSACHVYVLSAGAGCTPNEARKLKGELNRI